MKIIVHMDNSNLNGRGWEVNGHIMEMCKERKLNFINYSKKIKPNHLNWGKLHLNQKGSKVLCGTFLKEISNIFNWHYIDEKSILNNERCKCYFSHEHKRIDVITILKSICRENTNKLVFDHININSLRNKI